MWTSAQEPRNLYNFAPNRFVVLHPVQNARTVQPMPCLLIPRVSATNRPLDDDISVDSSPPHEDDNDVDQPSPAQDFATPRPLPLQGAVDPVSPADDQQHGSADASMGIDEPSLEEDPVAVEPEVDYSDIRYKVVPKATQRGRHNSLTLPDTVTAFIVRQIMPLTGDARSAALTSSVKPWCVRLEIPSLLAVSRTSMLA